MAKRSRSKRPSRYQNQSSRIHQMLSVCDRCNTLICQISPQNISTLECVCALFDFFLPSPSLSTVSSSHFTRGAFLGAAPRRRSTPATGGGCSTGLPPPLSGGVDVMICDPLLYARPADCAGAICGKKGAERGNRRTTTRPSQIVDVK